MRDSPGSSSLRYLPPDSWLVRTSTARAWASRGKFASASSEHSSAAAAPSPSGEHIARVSGKLISRSASTWSTLTSKRYCAFGFRLPWWWFFDAPTAICRCVVP